MTERESLLRAVCENPDDDTPRLVFADWLDEHGDPAWAEFIRLQCWLHRPGPGPWGPAEEDLWATNTARADRLLDTNREAWEGRLFRRSGLDPEVSSWGEFERGFCESLHIYATTVRGIDWDRVYAATPLRSLFLTEIEEADAAVQHPAARQLRHLGLSDCELSLEHIQAITRAPTLAKLESLRVETHARWITPQTEQLLRDRFGEALELEVYPLR